MADPIFRTYHLSNANQVGGELPYFVGKQYGNGWLRTLAKVAFPIVKRVAGVASNAAEDIIFNKKPVGSAIKDSALNELGKIMGQSQQPPPQQQRRRQQPRTSINRQKRKAPSYPIFEQTKRAKTQ